MQFTNNMAIWMIGTGQLDTCHRGEGTPRQCEGIETDTMAAWMWAWLLSVGEPAAAIRLVSRGICQWGHMTCSMAERELRASLRFAVSRPDSARSTHTAIPRPPLISRAPRMYRQRPSLRASPCLGTPPRSSLPAPRTGRVHLSLCAGLDEQSRRDGPGRLWVLTRW